jgi:hypothetical protein
MVSSNGMKIKSCQIVCYVIFLTIVVERKKRQRFTSREYSCFISLMVPSWNCLSISILLYGLILENFRLRADIYDRYSLRHRFVAFYTGTYTQANNRIFAMESPIRSFTSTCKSWWACSIWNCPWTLC